MIASRLLAECSMVVKVALRSVEIGFQRQAGKADRTPLSGCAARETYWPPGTQT